jgi:hypothetical protein
MGKVRKGRRAGRQAFRHANQAYRNRAQKLGFVTTRAFFAARLLNGTAVLPVTKTETAELLGGSRNDVAAAATVLASGDVELINKVTCGEIPLRAAAKQVGPLVRLAAAFSRASEDDRKTWVRDIVGVDAVFNLGVASSAPEDPAEVTPAENLVYLPERFDDEAAIARMTERLFGPTEVIAVAGSAAPGSQPHA